MNAADVKFINENIRPAADLLVQLEATATAILNAWNARGGVSAIPNDATVVADGAPGDGRNQITGAMVSNIIARLNEYKTDQDASSNAKLNTEFAVAVRVTPRF